MRTKRVVNNGMWEYVIMSGRYRITDWKAKIQAEGMQIENVELEMTGALQRSLTTGQIRGGAVLGFDSDQEKEKYDSMIALYGNVWRPSTLEQRNIQERFWNQIKKGMKNC